jgi:hypothetical protein
MISEANAKQNARMERIDELNRMRPRRCWTTLMMAATNATTGKGQRRTSMANEMHSPAAIGIRMRYFVRYE